MFRTSLYALSRCRVMLAPKQAMGMQGAATAAVATAATGAAQQRVKPIGADLTSTPKKKVIKKVIRKPLSVATPTTPAAAPAAADPAAAAAAATAASGKTPMVKGFRIDEVATLCTEADAIFARRLTSGGCQFFAWPGTTLAVASGAIVSMPDTIRTVHAVFGRPNTPIDLVIDVDCPVPPDQWSMTKIRPFQLKLLDEIMTVITAELEKIGEKIETQVVLQSPNLKKASFHVHTKLKDAAFADYNSLRGFLSRFHDKIPQVDLQIYRSNGMLRMFSCMKENHTSAMVVFDDPKWNIGFPDGKVSDAVAALHSVCIRPPGTYTRLLRFDAPRLNGYISTSSGAGSVGDSAHGDAKGDLNADGTPCGKPIPIPVLLPRTATEAVSNASAWLRQATEAEVGEWRAWIGLGICAYRIGYHFRDATGLPRPAMEEMLDAWNEASAKCSNKYHRGECSSKWATFDPSKFGCDSSDGSWWNAYQRLGRLIVPAQQAIAVEEARRSGNKIGSRDSPDSKKKATGKASITTSK